MVRFTQFRLGDAAESDEIVNERWDEECAVDSLGNPNLEADMRAKSMGRDGVTIVKKRSQPAGRSQFPGSAGSVLGGIHLEGRVASNDNLQLGSDPLLYFL